MRLFQRTGRKRRHGRRQRSSRIAMALDRSKRPPPSAPSHALEPLEPRLLLSAAPIVHAVYASDLTPDDGAVSAVQGFTQADYLFDPAQGTEPALDTSRATLAGWKWPDSRLPVPYYINTSNLPSGMSTSAYISAIDSAFQAWENIPSTYITFNRIGTGTQFATGAGDGTTTVGFGTAVPGALAHATTYADGLGVTEFDVVLGDDRASWSTGPGGSQVDVWATAAHEIGHGIGLGHSSDTNATMYFAIFIGSTHQRNPNADDISGLEQLYPNPVNTNDAPSIPGALSARSIQHDRATVGWGASSDPDGDPLNYSVQFRKSDLSTSWSPIQQTGATQRTLTGLEQNTAYNVRVRATDGELPSPWRFAQNLFTTTDSNDPPTQPGPLSATSVGRDKATIIWGGSTDADGDPITYRVQFRKNDLSDAWSPIIVVPTTTTTLTDLELNTSYRVRVRANDGGTVSSWRNANDLFTTSAGTVWPYVEDFADGVAQDFTAQSGNWSESGAAYEVQTDSANTLSILSLPDPLSTQYIVETLVTVTTGGNWKNAFIAFDVVDDTSYKLAQVRVGRTEWRMGQRTPNGFQWLTRQAAPVELDTAYTARVSVDGSVATLIVDGTLLVAHDYGESLSDGTIALGTLRSHARYDHVVVSPTTQTLYSEDFDDDAAEDFTPVSGTWSAINNRYELVSPSSDSASVLSLPAPLPADFDLSVSVNVQAGGQWKNASVIFDYVDPTNYKLISAAAGSDNWHIGQRSPSKFEWLQSVPLDVAVDNDYDLRIAVGDTAVELFVDGASLASHDFGEPLNDGQVGLGSRNSHARFDGLTMTSSSPTLYTESFNDGAADDFAPLAGTWSIGGGGYRVQTQSDETFSVLQLPVSLGIDFDLDLKVRVLSGGNWKNADVIFDFLDSTHYKLVSASAGSNRWRIGQRNGAGIQWAQTISQPIVVDTDYDMRIEIRGTIATLVVDGATLLSHEFADPLVDGALALGSRRSHARFDRLVVSAPSPAPLTALMASFGTMTGPGITHLSDFDQDGDIDDSDLAWLLSNGV